VDEVVVPERCRHCGQSFPDSTVRRGGRVWRHQVVEILPLAVWVTEHQMAVQRCPACGKHTRADPHIGCRGGRSVPGSLQWWPCYRGGIG
jgi:hypothetical protein